MTIMMTSNRTRTKSLIGEKEKLLDKLLLEKSAEYLKSFTYPLDFDKLAGMLKEMLAIKENNLEEEHGKS